ncbi:uncharacterized protein LOC131035963 [Cryptomeria japonica]|uniref:uncharacterized protein LOC131035963 n=1 Tax=Cryptomeria japonica TaxID=3369 RepID=UPI0025ABC56B|nr:uncharacterized protein LOC131035963 [Cryptomeria japonica]
MAEENSFYRARNQDDDDDKITEETIKEAQQDPKFGKFMEKVLEIDKEKYFVMLAHQGVKLPHDFDVTQLRQSERTSTLAEETKDKYVLQWLYKDEAKAQLEVNNVSIPIEKYGKGYDIMRKMGYGGNSPIGKRKEGILEPIKPPSQHTKDKSGLGFGQSNLDPQQEEEYERKQEEIAIQREEEVTRKQQEEEETTHK